MIHAGVSPMALRGDRHGQDVVAGFNPSVSFALVRHAPREMLRLLRCESTVTVEIHWPSGEAGLFLRCRIELSSRDSWRSWHRRHAHQAANHQSSQLAILAMTLLLAVCGWSVGGAEGMQRALLGSTPRLDETVISREKSGAAGPAT